MTDRYTETINTLKSSLHIDYDLDLTIYNILPKLYEARARYWTKGDHGYFTGSYSDGNSGGAPNCSGGMGVISDNGAKLSTAGQKVLTNSEQGGIITDDKKRKFKEKLDKGLINTTIDNNLQQNHVLSAAWLNSTKQAFSAIASGKRTTPKSRLFRRFDPQLLAFAFCGTGEFEYRLGSDSFDEFVALPFNVGVTFDKRTGKYVTTNIIQIKYGKNGVHIFPTKGKE